MTSSGTEQRRQRARGSVPLLLTLVALGAWFVWLAPTMLGGRATYTLVSGVSMEPQLHTGDLAVSRASSSYRIGDLVVIQIRADQGVGGSVIHRIVSGDAQSGWKTKGDNNSWTDPWTVPNDKVVGAFWFDLPGFGTALSWVAVHPLPFGAILAVLAALFYIPWHRKHVAPGLAAALATAEHESRREGRSMGEYAALAVSALGALVCLGLVGMLGMAHALMTPFGLVAGLGLLWTGVITLLLANRLFDGSGVPEPSHSRYALSGRLWLVADMPHVDEAITPVDSPVALRTIAEKYRLPVLHWVDADTGHQEFLLITEGHGCYSWAADLPAEGPHPHPHWPLHWPHRPVNHH